jgi:CPA2 family monovalent cation:H+ antiporter-2
MPHYTPLIGTIVAGLVIAFAMGALAHRLKVSPIAGYLLAGVIVGPFTPGYVADTGLALQLAEIGVILLMFGVGLHFSLRDLLAVRKIAVPGAVVQISVATAMGAALGAYLGWSLLAGIFFGLALSVASTVVLLRALETRNILETERGRIAVGWLIVEDLAMVLALVLLPAIAAITTGEGATANSIAWALGGTVLKVAGFIALMLVVGRRVIPWMLHWVVHTGSRELFRLAVLAIALGVAALAAFAFDVSFALGAFFAGMILGETPLSRRAGEETLPLRDAFAVLFFVAVGMLFDPSVLIERPLPLLATVLIIVFGKSVAAFAIVRAFGHPTQTALTVSASLAQIGEFSFILAGLGASLGVLPPEGRDLILAGAILSILANPVIFSLVAGRGQSARDEAAAQEKAVEDEKQRLREEHVILVGYGRVGRMIASEMSDRSRAIVIVEDQPDVARRARDAGFEVVLGNATQEAVLRTAGMERAAKLLIAIPEGFEGGVVAERARAISPKVSIIARAHSDAEVEHLSRLGADQVVMGERETAAKMLMLARKRSSGSATPPVPSTAA